MRFSILFSLCLCQDFIILDQVDQEFIKNDQICNQSGCVPLYFTPSNGILEFNIEFKMVYPGQRIPKGLHVKMDFKTGVKQAKLMDKKESSSEIIVTESSIVNEKVEQIAPIHTPQIDAMKPLSMEEFESLDMIFSAIEYANDSEDIVDQLKSLEYPSSDCNYSIKTSRRCNIINEQG
jgi:hypothetical protein